MGRTCSSCGADPGAGKFCQHCGTPLADEGASQPADIPPQPQTPPTAPAPQPIPQKRSGLRTGCLVVGVVLIALVAVGGYLGWRFVRNEILPGIEESASVFGSVSESPPGPCFDFESADGVLTGWTEVSCEGTRQAEVSFAALFEEGPFPGDDHLIESAVDTCLTAFENYVGISPEQSAYDVDWLIPTENLWASGVRKGICLVVNDDRSPLTGTVKGSNR